MLLRHMQLHVLLLLVFQIVPGLCIYCVEHHGRSQRPVMRTCPENHKRSTTVATQNESRFDISCQPIGSDLCNQASANLNQAGLMISTVLNLQLPINVNVTFESFCDNFDECTLANGETSIAQSYPAMSYMMTDTEDNMTRMYPQGLLKQLDVSVKPKWTSTDIVIQFNTDINWYFSGNGTIGPHQSDFLRTTAHELIHGLGFVSSWSDDLYNSFLSYYSQMPQFLTPLQLAPVSIDIQHTNTPANSVIFWGFVEYPLDKLIGYNNYRLTEVSHLLNTWQNSNAIFGSTADMVNDWYKSSIRLSAEYVYKMATTSRDMVFSTVNETFLLTEVSLSPFRPGSSMSHVDHETYVNSSDYLMVYNTPTGTSMATLLNQYPLGPIGPGLARILAQLGYVIQSSYGINIPTTKPQLKYWSPPSNLVGTPGNPNATEVVDSQGPAQSSLSTNSSSNASTHKSHTSSSFALHRPIRWSVTIAAAGTLVHILFI